MSLTVRPSGSTAIVPYSDPNTTPTPSTAQAIPVGNVKVNLSPQASSLAFGGAAPGATTSLRAQMSTLKLPVTFGPESLDFSKGLQVISNAQKFIIPVPKLGEKGEPLVYPEGHEKAGQPIVDWQGKPIGDKGLVFFNGKDRSQQAVKGDGEGVIIINQVSEDQGRKLIEQIGSDPNTLDVRRLKEILVYAREVLGLDDMYNSDRAFIRSKMNALESAATSVEAYGLHRRDDRDVCSAVYVPGAGEFRGPAASPQKFDNGAVIIQQGESYRLCQPGIFLETYAKKDGAPLSVSDLPTQRPSV